MSSLLGCSSSLSCSPPAPRTREHGGAGGGLALEAAGPDDDKLHLGARLLRQAEGFRARAQAVQPCLVQHVAHATAFQH